MKRQKTKYVGVYARTSTARPYHNGKPDTCFDVTFKAVGRKIWKKVGWRSEGYTAVLASHIRAEHIQGKRHHLTTNMTFADAWGLYDREWLTPNVDGAITDRSRCTLHLLPSLGPLLLNKISPLDLERLKLDLHKKGLAPQTVRHCLALVRRVYRKLSAWGKWSGPMPTDSVKFPHVDNKRYRWLQHDEAQTLLTEIKRRSLQTHNIALISLHTGLRAGEIHALTGERIDLRTSTIQILDTKTGRNRTAYMTPTVKAMLQEINPTPGELVFKSRDNTRIKAVSRAFSRAVDALDLNQGIDDRRGRVVFHTLRHTYGSWLAKAGLGPHRIGELMGHSNHETTKRYAHLCPSQQSQSAALVQAVANGQQFSAHQPSAPNDFVDMRQFPA